MYDKFPFMLSYFHRIENKQLNNGHDTSGYIKPFSFI